MFCVVAILLVGVAPARALTRWEPPAQWQIYQDVVSYAYYGGVDSECVFLSPRHSYENGEMAFDLTLGTDKACRVYGDPGQYLGKATVDRRTFATTFDGYHRRVLPQAAVNTFVSYDLATDPWDHPTLNVWRGQGVSVRKVFFTENRLHKTFHVSLPEGVTLFDDEPYATLADGLCRTNGGWNFDVVDTATGDLSRVRCHTTGVLSISTLNLQYTPQPRTVHGTHDWDARTDH